MLTITDAISQPGCALAAGLQNRNDKAKRLLRWRAPRV